MFSSSHIVNNIFWRTKKEEEVKLLQDFQVYLRTGESDLSTIYINIVKSIFFIGNLGILIIHIM